MTNPHGSFIWYELMTADSNAAKRFYDEVVGWQIDAAPAPDSPGGIDYRMIKAPDGAAGGVIQLNKDMLAGGARPIWMPYFGVGDVDDAVKSIVDAGGQVHMPATDIPGVGRIAMVTDPQGVPIYVMRGASDETSAVYQRSALGHVSWNELLTPDPDASLAFYEKQFNVRKIGAMPMGEMGDYSFIAHGGDDAIGAVMKTPPGAPSGWGFYFRVAAIDAAKARVEKAGGKITNGPMEVPSGEWILNAVDPEGVAFSLVAPAK